MVTARMQMRLGDRRAERTGPVCASGKDKRLLGEAFASNL